MVFSDALSINEHGHSEKKKVLNIEQSNCGFASTVQKPELADQNF